METLESTGPGRAWETAPHPAAHPPSISRTKACHSGGMDSGGMDAGAPGVSVGMDARGHRACLWPSDTRPS